MKKDTSIPYFLGKLVNIVVKEKQFLFKEEQLKLDFTFKVIKSVVDKKSTDFQILNELSKIDNLIRENGSSIIKEMDEHYELENWNSFAKQEVE